MRNVALACLALLFFSLALGVIVFSTDLHYGKPITLKIEADSALQDQARVLLFDGAALVKQGKEILGMEKEQTQSQLQMTHDTQSALKATAKDSQIAAKSLAESLLHIQNESLPNADKVIAGLTQTVNVTKTAIATNSGDISNVLNSTKQAVDALNAKDGPIVQSGAVLATARGTLADLGVEILAFDPTIQNFNKGSATFVKAENLLYDQLYKAFFPPKMPMMKRIGKFAIMELAPEAIRTGFSRVYPPGMILR